MAKYDFELLKKYKTSGLVLGGIWYDYFYETFVIGEEFFEDWIRAEPGEPAGEEFFEDWVKNDIEDYSDESILDDWEFTDGTFT